MLRPMKVVKEPYIPCGVSSVRVWIWRILLGNLAVSITDDIGIRVLTTRFISSYHFHCVTGLAIRVSEGMSVLVLGTG